MDSSDSLIFLSKKSILLISDNSKVFEDIVCTKFIIIISRLKNQQYIGIMQQMLIINKRFYYVLSNSYFWQLKLITMKNIFILLCALTIVSCKEEPKNYVTFSGKISNKTGDSLMLRNRTMMKTIALDADGNFSDTLTIDQPEVFGFFNGAIAAPIFLKNGFDMTMNADGENFEETLEFPGSGAEHNKFFIEQMRLEKDFSDHDSLSSLSSEGLKTECRQPKKLLPFMSL